MNLNGYVKPKYKKIFETFLEVSGITDQWVILSNLAYLDCLVDGWEEMLDTYMQSEIKVNYLSEKEEDAILLSINEEYSIVQEDSSTHLVLPADNRTSKQIAMLLYAEVSKIYYILPYKRKGFNPHVRLLTDVILTDATELGCTDVRFDTEANFDNTFNNVVSFRQGVYLVKQKKYKLNKQLVKDIVADLLTNRSSVRHKLAELPVSSAVRFRLVDESFPSRCQIGKSIGGITLTMRLFDFKRAPNIEKLGFTKSTQYMLHRTSNQMNGLTLVSGVFGSGKGTTLNAVGMEMEKEGKLAIASLDDPIEYLRNYPQYEYSNERQLKEYVDAFKKMDLNAVFLNEIITTPASEAVYNLVSSGVHVLTTVHNHRVFRIMYKLKELLGDRYLSLIPFINVISYQDKFSVCCTECLQGISKENFKEGSDEEKLLTFLGLDIIQQPSGCSNCEDGIVKKGIKVVSEHIEFNDQIKSNLLKLDLHEQFDYLKEVNMEGNNLEEIIRDSVETGTILLGEALIKLDTWR